jgi:ABC-type transport system substrate-binding protein
MIEKIDVIDDLHFTVTTKSPFAPMLNFLADDPILMVNPEQREAVGDAGLKKYENMIGTGPFMRGELESEVHGRMDANPNYFVKGQPYLDGIEHIAISADAQEGAFLAGEFDSFDTFTAGGYSFQVSSFQDQMGDKVDFRKRLHSAIAEVHMHNEKAPFNDQRVRRAVQLIINRQLTANPFGPGSGIIMGPVPQMFHPFAMSEQELLQTPGYREDKEADIKEAIALASAAGLSADDPLTIATPIQCDCHAVQIKEDVKAIGLNLELEPATGADYFAQRAAGNYVMNIGLEVGGTDADTYLHHRFHSTGAFNRVGVNDPELDALLDKQRTTIDNEARAAAIKEVSLMLLEKSPQAFVSSLIFYPIFRSYMKGVPEKVPFGLTHNFSTVWLDSNMM